MATAMATATAMAAPTKAGASAASISKQATQAVRASLKARLPHYMVPSFFVGLDELPTHPISGKLDTKAFPQTIADLLTFITKHTAIEDAADAVDAASSTERMLTDVWAEVCRALAHPIAAARARASNTCSPPRLTPTHHAAPHPPRAAAMCHRHRNAPAS